MAFERAGTGPDSTDRAGELDAPPARGGVSERGLRETELRDRRERLRRERARDLTAVLKATMIGTLLSAFLFEAFLLVLALGLVVGTAWVGAVGRAFDRRLRLIDDALDRLEAGDGISGGAEAPSDHTARGPLDPGVPLR